MNCKKIEKLILTDYIDGNLKGCVLEELETHLKSCPACRKLAEEAAYTKNLFKSVPRQEAPAGMWRKIQVEISAQPAKGLSIKYLLDRIRCRLPTLKPAFVMTSTAVILLLIVTALWLMPRKDSFQTVYAQDDLLALSYSNGEGDESVYDLGTTAEQVFL